MKIRARAPLRIGISGGGTDVPPYCDVYGGLVLNATIDKYAYTTIETTTGDVVSFKADDIQVEEVVELKDFPLYGGKLKLHSAVYSYMMLNYNDGVFLPLKVSTYCDAPIGSGLGSSSTIVVSLVSAFCNLLDLSFDDYQLAKLAFYIERKLCGLKGGSQDQYAAAFGGVNFMEFCKDNHVIVSSLRIKERILCEFESSLILYFSGISRESADIISQQSRCLEEKKASSLEAMHNLKFETKRMKDALLMGDFEIIVDSLNKGWISKKKSSSSVSNAQINQIFEAAINAGAKAGKISGAGGGGFILFFVPLEKRKKVLNVLAQFNGFATGCHFTKHGAQSWRIKE